MKLKQTRLLFLISVEVSFSVACQNQRNTAKVNIINDDVNMKMYTYEDEELSYGKIV